MPPLVACRFSGLFGGLSGYNRGVITPRPWPDGIPIRYDTAMKIIEKLRTRLGRDSFQPTILNLVASPDYIIRRGLYLAIKELATSISGNVLDFGCGSK